MATPAPIEPVREFDLVPPDNTRLANLCGALDENLRLIEDRIAWAHEGLREVTARLAEGRPEQVDGAETEPA